MWHLLKCWTELECCKRLLKLRFRGFLDKVVLWILSCSLFKSILGPGGAKLVSKVDFGRGWKSDAEKTLELCGRLLGRRV